MRAAVASTAVTAATSNCGSPALTACERSSTSVDDACEQVACACAFDEAERQARTFSTSSSRNRARCAPRGPRRGRGVAPVSSGLEDQRSDEEQRREIDRRSATVRADIVDDLSSSCGPIRPAALATTCSPMTMQKNAFPDGTARPPGAT